VLQPSHCCLEPGDSGNRFHFDSVEILVHFTSLHCTRSLHRRNFSIAMCSEHSVQVTVSGYDVISDNVILPMRIFSSPLTENKSSA
jgi:hypothetical protein